MKQVSLNRQIVESRLREIAVDIEKLEKFKGLPPPEFEKGENFAQGVLKNMAGYRNRLIHFYYEITKKELLEIIQKNLEDLERFCKYIMNFIEDRYTKDSRQKEV